VADVPLKRYGERAITRQLSNLEWVSRAAVSHEAVVESCLRARALVPMKLFTIFTSDERAVEHVRRQWRRIGALARRVADHQEWGVRVTLSGVAPPERPASASPDRRRPGGLGYLLRKKAQRDLAAELEAEAPTTVAKLYDRLKVTARAAKRRTPRELAPGGGRLLLDAAFLVRRSRSKAFRTMTARQAARLQTRGYHVALSGPWPPYTFVQE
jgi:hypothetical protein